MRSIARLWLICSFLCSAFLSSAQTAKSIDVPGSLMAAGQYRMASIEYERVWLESGNKIVSANALLGKAQALKQLGQFENAEHVLYRISHDSLPDSLSYIVRYQLALCMYLQGKFAQAEDVLDQMYFTIDDSLLTAPSLMLYALSLNEERRWDEAKEKMMRMITCSGLDSAAADSLINVVETMYDPQNYPRLKNVKMARVLSMILPGSGQVYAGSAGQGIVSMILNAAAITFTVYSFNVGTYFTAAGSAFSIFGRFYSGGGRNAEKTALKKNYERSKVFNEQLKQKVVIVTKASLNQQR